MAESLTSQPATCQPSGGNPSRVRCRWLVRVKFSSPACWHRRHSPGSAASPPPPQHAGVVCAALPPAGFNVLMQLRVHGVCGA